MLQDVVGAAVAVVWARAAVLALSQVRGEEGRVGAWPREDGEDGIWAANSAHGLGGLLVGGLEMELCMRRVEESKVLVCAWGSH